MATVTFLFVAPFAGSAGLRGATLIAAVAALLVVLWRRPDLDALPVAVLAMFGGWALLASASVLWSVERAYTMGELRSEVLYAAGVFAVFFLAARQPSRWPRWRTALLGGTLAVAVLHVAQDFLPFAISRHASEGQGGLWSTHLVLVAPLVLTLGVPRPWGAGAGPFAQGLALVLLFGAAWDTGNRAVWVALCAQLVVVFAFAPAAGVDRERLRAFRGLAIAGAVVVVLALGLATRDRVALAHPGATVSTGLASDLRPHIWRLAWQKFLEAPVLGHGFGREVLGDTFEKAPMPETGKHPPVRHSHNLFMDMALQLGVVGLAVFVVLLLALAARYGHCLRDPRLSPIGVAGLALLLGFVLKNLTDDFLYRHNALVFWAMNGMLLGLARPTR